MELKDQPLLQYVLYQRKHLLILNGIESGQLKGIYWEVWNAWLILNGIESLLEFLRISGIVKKLILNGIERSYILLLLKAP